MNLAPQFVITCEHGGNEVPSAFGSLFSSTHARSKLKSHRGYDPGSLAAATQFHSYLHSLSTVSRSAGTQASDARNEGGLFTNKVTRLLVDLNRSRDNPELFSGLTRHMDDAAKAEILATYYTPYRDAVTDRIAELVTRGASVVHLSFHTFTPRIQGRWRPIDVGLLFDPSRRPENRFCQKWKKAIGRIQSNLRVFMNQPYAGVDDGLTTALRKIFDEKVYLGIEVEISNRYFRRRPEIQEKVVESLWFGLRDFFDR